MAMSLRRNVTRTQDDLRRMEHHYREQGFADGWAGKPASSVNAVYQQAWKRGREARERDGGDGAA